MRFEGHESDVNAVRFHPAGEAIATACNDGTVSREEGKVGEEEGERRKEEKEGGRKGKE